MTVETDRRSKFRKRPLSLVYVELASGNGGMMRDLCEEGFALRAMMPLRPGETTSFTFSLDTATRVEGEGRMIWVEEGGRVAGLEFTNISSENLRQIQSWLQRTEEAPPPREAETPASTPPQNSILEDLRHEARTVPGRPVVAKSDAPRPVPPPMAEVTVFPAPSKPESQTPPREIPTPEALKKEIAEALRQAASERAANEGPADEQRPPVYAPPPPVYAAPPPPPPPALEPPPAVKLWDPFAPALEPLPSPEMMDYSRGRRSGFTLSRAIGIMLLIALAAAGYVYRRDVGRQMIQLGQKISGNESAGSQLPDGESTAPGRPEPGTTESRDARSSSGSSAESQPSTIPLPGSSVSGSPSSGTAAPAAAENDGPLTVEPNTSASSGVGTTNDGRTSAGRRHPSAGVLPGRSSSSTVIPVSPLISGGTSAAGAEVSPESGQTEYLQALQILRGKNGRADMPEAARLLWLAVEKGNSNAEVALAELYRLGQGVAHNCDQARVLLTAAARKGNPEGVRHLQLFEQAGCE
jgi:hypothetical protein